MDPKANLTQLHNELIKICEGAEYSDGTTQSKIKTLLRLTSRFLNVFRVSIWGYSLDRSSIVCRFLYESDKDAYDSGMVLSIESFPSYFEAMSSSRVIVADDARTHPATCEFTESYLTPLQIYSMVDAPVYSSYGHHGILCVEDNQPSRNWGVEEVSFIIAIADKISLAMENEAWLKASEKLLLAQRTDPLTGLENRLAFQEVLEHVAGETKVDTSGAESAVLIVGLDRFSELNDELGYEQANEVLIHIADRLRDLALNEAFHLSRISGDLFALLVENIQSDIVTLAQLIKATLEAEIRLLSGQLTAVTTSIGATIITSGFDDADNPVRKAEIALAKAKENGRGSISLFEDAWISEYQQKKSDENELLIALKQEQLIPFYQPIIDSHLGRVIGVEALVRWNHPTRGILTPFHFLSLASEIRVMPQLGELMLKSVFQDIASHEQLRSLSWVSVNLSAEQLYSNTLVNLLASLFVQHKIPKSMIKLEIIEELLCHETTLVTDQLKALDELGVKLAIDDFGTGYSSLSRLKHLPVSKIKIDRSFVDGLPQDESDCCIASSIVGMAKGLNLEVVAEGVETEEQAAWLIDKQCDFLQGYLYAKPLNINDLVRFIAEKNLP